MPAKHVSVYLYDKISVKCSNTDPVQEESNIHKLIDRSRYLCLMSVYYTLFISTSN